MVIYHMKQIKKLYGDIVGYRKDRRQRFTRNVSLVADLALGKVGTIAGLIVAIDDPAAGFAMFQSARGELINIKV